MKALAAVVAATLILATDSGFSADLKLQDTTLGKTVHGPDLSFGDMKVGEVLKLIQTDGWSLVTVRGSHRQFKHSTKPGRVTVPGKPSDDLAPGTLNSILKQAGFK